MLFYRKSVIYMATEKKIELELKNEMASPVQDGAPDFQPQYLANSSEISSSNDLIHYLYQSKSQAFKYCLVQSRTIDLPLYRERNFGYFS